jgi:hypothetical protein
MYMCYYSVAETDQKEQRSLLYWQQAPLPDYKHFYIVPDGMCSKR